MIIKKALAMISLLTTVTAFAQQKKTDDFKLSGSIAAHALGKAYLYYEKNGTIEVDSTDVVNGEFKIAGQVEGPTFARLVFTSTVTAKSAILSFFLEPGMVSVSSSDTLKNVTVSGSESDIDFLPIRKALVAYNAKLSGLNQQARRYQAVKDTLSFNMIRKKMDKLEEDLKNDTYRKFVGLYPASPVSLHALDKVAGTYLDPKEIEPLFNSLSPQIRDSKAGRYFTEKIETAKATSPGSYLPDFSHPDTSGRLVSLSSFKGKYVLVEFWASWCAPCRAASPGLVKAFNTYQDKGFTILGISLDKNKESWLRAIRADKLYWTQLSDLKYWENDIAKKFHISFIPQNMLLDPTGKIIARDLQVDELSKTLFKILK